jgi:hypothetical protein
MSDIWLPCVLRSPCGCVRTESVLSSGMEISTQPFMQADVCTTIVTDEVGSQCSLSTKLDGSATQVMLAGKRCFVTL